MTIEKSSATFTRILNYLSNMENLNTVDSILEALQKMAQRKEPIDTHTWLSGVSKLLALLGDDQDWLYEMESEIAKSKARFISDGDTAAKAKIKAEAMDVFKNARKLKAKIDRCYEIIRVAKLQARLSNDEYKSQ